MSRPPTEPGVADASTFFAGSGQTAALRPLQQEATAPDKMDDVHCLATLLEAAHAPRAPTALVQARALVAEYGTLSAVLLAVAQGEGSVRHLPEGVRVLLLLVRESAHRLHRARLQRGNVLAERPALNAYLLALLGREKTEQMRVLFLDGAGRLIADELLGRGTVDHAPVYPREIVRRALALRAGSFVLVHNHPSGDAMPSAEDVSMTGQIVAAAHIVGLQVADHLIVGRDHVLSMKEAGLL